MTNRGRSEQTTTAASSPSPPYYESVPGALHPPQIPISGSGGGVNDDIMITLVPDIIHYPSVPVASHSETTPLIINRKRRESREGLIVVLAAMVLVLLVGCWTASLITYWNDPLSPSVRDRIRKEWAHESLQHEELARNHQQQEAKWKREQIAHDELVREWEREREVHDRKKRERELREEEERRRLNMVWVDVEPHDCTTYATRKYTARLANVPSDYRRRVEACKAIPLVVHGQSYLSHTCEDNGPNATIGSWNVDQSQPDCVPFWADYKDKGCTTIGSGKRRIEHHLENLPSGSDWREFTATTPIRFNGMQFSGAQAAFQSVWGVYGLWEIDDHEC